MKETPFLKDNEAILQKVKDVKLFDALSKKELRDIMALSKLRSYKKGESIIREGEYDCWVYFLLTGSVNVIVGDRTIRTLSRKGDIFGEMGIIDGSPRSASIVANEDNTGCLGMDAAIMDRISKENEVNALYLIYRVFAEVFSGRLRSATQENVELKDENEKLKMELDLLKAQLATQSN
ncbi:MAG: cyclic nucleotide-binding domain-containing protein [Deltaproteobacteria bacterium]|nr:cyclic nucleotide-binding domain-containing protein [Deltaproteobacteria bacterium]